MKKIEQALDPISGYLILMERDTQNGWYQLKIGLPISWVYDENDSISCEVDIENEEGRIIIVAPKVEGIVIDDLVDFVSLVINTNKKITQKEDEFEMKMDNFKKDLKEQAKAFYADLDELKSNSFKKFNKSNDKDDNETDTDTTSTEIVKEETKDEEINDVETKTEE